MRLNIQLFANEISTTSTSVTIGDTIRVNITTDASYKVTLMFFVYDSKTEPKGIDTSSPITGNYYDYVVKENVYDVLKETTGTLMISGMVESYQGETIGFTNDINLTLTVPKLPTKLVNVNKTVSALAIGGKSTAKDDEELFENYMASKFYKDIEATNVISRNLFNINAITPNKYLKQLTGELTDTQNSNVSNYIKVVGGQTYTISLKYDTLKLATEREIIYYNNDKSYRNYDAYNSENKIITINPTQDGYIRFDYDKNCYDIQVEEGTVSTDYVPYLNLEEAMQKTDSVPINSIFDYEGDDVPDGFIEVSSSPTPSGVVEQQTEFVVFGDSWSDLSVPDSIWSTKVATALGLNLHNYAVNGAGFVSPTTNLISTQINTFINSSVDKTKVKYIVLLGGINDYRNGVTYSTLATSIINNINTLKTACPNTKILYVNNTQYPHNQTQDRYWDDLIKTITKTIIIPTYNMSGAYSNDLYNSNNYFHLTKEGQQFMAKNIFSSLVGGELITFLDERVIENSDGIVTYRTEKVSSNMVNIKLRFVPSLNKTAYSVSFSSSLPELPYYELTDIEGNVLRGFRKPIIDVESRSIAIACETSLGKGHVYDFNIIGALW